MSASTIAIYTFPASFLVFFGLAAFLIKWRNSLDKSRPPLEFLVLRGPRHSLRERREALFESLETSILFAPLLPGLLASIALIVLLSLLGSSNWALAVGIAVTIFILVSLPFAYRLVRKASEASNYSLGYKGELVAAQHLEPLKALGYHIFHDMPGSENGRSFNIDHVAVGPSGVCAIETKTRRKGRTRPGFKDHEVTYDGSQLIWPWGEDDWGLQQAHRQARWLRQWIHKRTGLNIEVQAILNLPGWYVKQTCNNGIRVVNSKSLESAVVGKRGPAKLNLKEIDLLQRQFREVCTVNLNSPNDQNRQP